MAISEKLHCMHSYALDYSMVLEEALKSYQASKGHGISILYPFFKKQDKLLFCLIMLCRALHHQNT